MSLVVRAGCRVRARVTIKNDGVLQGTFRLRGQTLYTTGNLAGAVAGNFFNNPTIHTETNLPEQNEYYIDTVFNGGEQKTVTMYSANWAGSNPAAFSSGYLFDVIWKVEVLETGEVFEFMDDNALQHQQVTQSKPVFAGVTYDLVTCP